MRSFHPSRRSLPFNEWPDPDRVAWDRAIHRGTALEDAGRGAKWAPDTRVRYCWAYGRWLRFLTDRGELDGSVAPIGRLSKERLLAWVDRLRAQELASSSIASHLQALHNVFWGMWPEADIGFLRELTNHLVTTARPKKSKAGRLWPIDAVYEAALGMMDDADRTPPPRPLWDSTRYRDGLMIAILCATALRRKNIASLCVGCHLTRHEDVFHLSIPGEEMKNGQPIEFELPKSPDAVPGPLPRASSTQVAAGARPRSALGDKGGRPFHPKYRLGPRGEGIRAPRLPDDQPRLSDVRGNYHGRGRTGARPDHWSLSWSSRSTHLRTLLQ